MKSPLWLAFSGLVALSAIAATSGTAPNLHEQMKNVIAVQTQVVWDISSKVLDDNGNPDASRLKAADWSQIIAAAGKVRDASQVLASGPVMVAAPGQKIQDEGTPGAFGAKAVQGVIDANPKAFSAFSLAMAGSMSEIIATAQARDAKKLDAAAGQLDQLCEQCHKQFWYPNQGR